VAAAAERISGAWLRDGFGLHRDHWGDGCLYVQPPIV
jgi:hypothetical protein